jgi:hypothetical protein
MATKRSTSPEPVVSSGAAPARAKSTVTRKHRNSAVTERSESAIAPTSAATQTPDPTLDEIAQLAYSYWEARGYQGGSSEEDWLRAEQELRAGLTMSVAN